MGDPHLKLIKSDGVFAEIAEANRLAHLQEEQARRRAEQCGQLHELQRTPSGAYISPSFWVPLRCTAAPRHIGPCRDDTGILFHPSGGRAMEGVVDWNGYEDADVYDLAMSLKEDGLT